MNSLHLPKRPEDTRVVVAMSGGVDSSVVAGLLHAQGYQVIGITLQLYDHGAAAQKKGACCAGQDIHDARQVATTLGVPHYVLDYERRFATSVIDKFAASYAAGETPVPCVLCNQTVKFRDLFQAARDLGADALATGHYIASRPGAAGMELYRAADAERDQSYFLFATTPDQLQFLRFPLGDMRKVDVRALAEKMGLAVAEKSDSQDICFVPSGRYTNVINRLRPDAAIPGRIVHIDGRDLGAHAGIVNYTIGQRRGLGVATGDPLFVVDLDPGTATVIVGPRGMLRAHALTLRDVNWLGDAPLMPGASHDIFARIRSTQAPAAATLRIDENGSAQIVLHGGEDGISPGQACVFYADGSPRTRVLGGGWIAHVDKPAIGAMRRETEALVAHRPQSVG